MLVSCNPTHQIVLVRRYRLRGSVETFGETRISRIGKSQQNRNGMLCLSKDKKMLEEIRSRLKHYTREKVDRLDTTTLNPKIFVIGSNQMKSHNDKNAKGASTFHNQKYKIAQQESTTKQ